MQSQQGNCLASAKMKPEFFCSGRSAFQFPTRSLIPIMSFGRNYSAVFGRVIRLNE